MEDARDLARTRTLRLLDRAMAGEADAARLLFDGLTERLLARARHHPILPKLRPPADPRDIVHDALKGVIAAYREGHRLEDHGPGSFERYLHTCIDGVLVTRLRSQDTLKRGGGEVVHSIDGTTVQQFEPAAQGTGVGHLAAARELRDLCLASLDGEARAVLALAIEGCLTQQQIAARLQVPVSSVRQGLRTARERLARMFADREA